MLPSQTSKPASARMYASDSVSRLVSQLVLLQSRPCCRRTAGLGRVATGGEKEGEQGRCDGWGGVSVGRGGGVRITRCKDFMVIWCIVSAPCVCTNLDTQCIYIYVYGTLIATVNEKGEICENEKSVKYKPCENSRAYSICTAKDKKQMN